jgi:hypothetical protein
MKTKRIIRRFARVAVLGAIRGIAAAAGSAATMWIIWWLQNH